MKPHLETYHCPWCGGLAFSPGPIQNGVFQEAVFCSRCGKPFSMLGRYERKPSFASTQFNLEGDALQLVRDMQDRIDSSDLASKGKEDEPHITVKYGLHSMDAGPVRELVEAHGPVNATIEGVDCFESDEHDVVILRVGGSDIHELNAKIAGLPHTDTHPTYKPHATIAYVKPGVGKRYVKSLGEMVDEPIPIQFKLLVFSPKGEAKTAIEMCSYPWAENGKFSYARIVRDRMRDSAGGILRYALKQVPAGKVITSNGKTYRGGMWVSEKLIGQAVDAPAKASKPSKKADGETAKKVAGEKVKAGTYHEAVKAKASAKKPSAKKADTLPASSPKVDADSASIDSLLAPHAAIELTAKERGNVKRSLSALKRHHGDNVVKRIAELATAAHQAMQAATNEPAKANLAKKLREYGEMMAAVRAESVKAGQLNEATAELKPRKEEAKSPEPEMPAAPANKPASNSYADFVKKQKAVKERKKQILASATYGSDRFRVRGGIEDQFGEYIKRGPLADESDKALLEAFYELYADAGRLAEFHTRMDERDAEADIVRLSKTNDSEARQRYQELFEDYGSNVDDNYAEFIDERKGWVPQDAGVAKSEQGDLFTESPEASHPPTPATQPVSAVPPASALDDLLGQLRTENPGKAIAIRVGDFYEFHGDDATRAATALHTNVANRKSVITGITSPVLAIPHQAIDKMLTHLERAGIDVAVADLEAEMAGGAEVKVKGDTDFESHLQDSGLAFVGRDSWSGEKSHVPGEMPIPESLDAIILYPDGRKLLATTQEASPARDAELRELQKVFGDKYEVTRFAKVDGEWKEVSEATPAEQPKEPEPPPPPPAKTDADHEQDYNAIQSQYRAELERSHADWIATEKSFQARARGVGKNTQKYAKLNEEYQDAKQQSEDSRTALHRKFREELQSHPFEAIRRQRDSDALKAKREVEDRQRTERIAQRAAEAKATIASAQGTTKMQVVDAWFPTFIANEAKSAYYKPMSADEQEVFKANLLDSISNLDKMIQDKDVKLGGMLHTRNPMFRDYFAAVTGIGLPKTEKGTTETLNAFIGQAKINAIAAAKQAERQAKIDAAVKAKADARAALDAKYHGYTASMAPYMAATVDRNLGRSVRADGVNYASVRDFVESKLQAGYRVDNGRFKQADGRYFDAAGIGASAINYAAYRSGQIQKAEAVVAETEAAKESPKLTPQPLPPPVAPIRPISASRSNSDDEFAQSVRASVKLPPAAPTPTFTWIDQQSAATDPAAQSARSATLKALRLNGFIANKYPFYRDGKSIRIGEGWVKTGPDANWDSFTNEEAVAELNRITQEQAENFNRRGSPLRYAHGVN